MNVSALDLANGTYGVQNVGDTSQHLGTVPSFPTRAALPPPNGYETWTQAYETGFIK